MVKKVLKTLIPSIILVIGLVFFLDITVDASPYSPTTSWQGNENARDINQFGGSYSTMNAYKVWSVCKAAGFSDQEAAGVMANFLAECTFHPEVVEGHESNEAGDTLESVEEYINKHTSKIQDAKTRTEYTDDLLLHGYHVSQADVSAGKAGTLATATTGRPSGLSLSTYYNNGNGYVGIGLPQFTGASEHDPLFAFMEAHNAKWWDMDNQLIFIFAHSDQGGYPKGGEKLEQWRDENQGKDASYCAETFRKLFVMSSAGNRQNLATQIYQTLQGKGWDDEYGKMILSMSGFVTGGSSVITHEGIEDKGLIESIVGRAVEYPRNNGFILAEDDRENKNKIVWTDYINALKSDSDSGGDTSYSLFELYGEDVHWYNYFGESSHVPVLMDHIYSGYIEDRTDELGFKDIFYTAYNYLSCNVYPDRPTVLTTNDISNGLTDPRVSKTNSTISNAATSAASAYAYINGSIKLTICKFVVSLTSFLMGPELREYISSVITDLEESNFFQIIRTPILIIVGIGIVVWIVTFVVKIFKWIKEGSTPLRQIIMRFLALIVSLGIIFFALYKPSACNKLVDTVLNVVDEIFDATLAKTLENDEIVSVNDTSKATHAAIWKTAIFKPWVRGQFGGLDYDQLYTNYETNLKWGQSQMPQSNDKESPNPTLDEPYYNSTKLTGDVFVYRGNGKYIRNWAAYLYSVGSPYHIDSTLDKTTAEKFEDLNLLSFPNFAQKTTANDGELYADLFRIIDAQMDISPQYYPNGEVINNYTHSKELNPSYISQSIVMIFNCLLLIPFYPVIFQKLIAFIRLIISLLNAMIHSIIEIFKENSGLGKIWEDIKENFIKYVLASMKLMLLVTIYYILVDKGLLLMIVYVIVAWNILNIKISDIKRSANNIKQTAKTIKNKYF